MAIQIRALMPITEPRRSTIEARRSSSETTAAMSRSPSARIGSPAISDGTGDAEALQDRRRDVGREHVAAQPGAVGGEVAVEAAARDPDRQLLVGLGRRALEGDQQVVAAQRAREAAEVGDLDVADADRGEAAVGPKPGVGA